jgi:hypothetical protein
MRDDVKAFVSVMCRENWEATTEEKNGGLGVACMQAYLNGIKPAVKELSEFLQVGPEDLEYPFQNLLQSGMFSKSFNARGDTSLNLDPKKNKRDKNAEEMLRDMYCAWGHVAAISSGLIIRNYSNMHVGEDNV